MQHACNLQDSARRRAQQRGRTHPHMHTRSLHVQEWAMKLKKKCTYGIYLFVVILFSCNFCKWITMKTEEKSVLWAFLTPSLTYSSSSLVAAVSGMHPSLWRTLPRSLQSTIKPTVSSSAALFFSRFWFNDHLLQTVYVCLFWHFAARINVCRLDILVCIRVCLHVTQPSFRGWVTLDGLDWKSS